jgi:6-pyruvoyl-tetrahydropterin synthase
MSNLILDLDLNKNNSSLKIDKNLMSKINDQSLVFLDKSSSKKTIVLISNEIRSNCSNVFSSLVKQSQDRNFIFFLNELSEKIDKYIEDLTKHILCLDDALKKNQSELSKNGYYFNKLDEKLIDEILDKSKNYLKRFRENIKNNNTSRESLSVNTGSIIRIIAKKLNSEFDKLGILKDVSNYMKRNYEVTGVSLEMSTPNSSWWKKKETVKKAPKTLYAHLDESLIYPKSICYLSNVSEDNGPTSFYPKIYKSLKLNFLQDIVGRVIDTVGRKGSPLFHVYNQNVEQKLECNVFKSHLSELPNELKFYSHFGWYVEPDSEIENQMINDEIKLIGTKGTFVVFDGAKVIHRGGLLKTGERIVLQIIFGPKKNFIQKVIRKIFH